MAGLYKQIADLYKQTAKTCEQKNEFCKQKAENSQKIGVICPFVSQFLPEKVVKFLPNLGRTIRPTKSRILQQLLIRITKGLIFLLDS